MSHDCCVAEFGAGQIHPLSEINFVFIFVFFVLVLFETLVSFAVILDRLFVCLLDSYSSRSVFIGPTKNSPCSLLQCLHSLVHLADNAHASRYVVAVLRLAVSAELG